MASVTTAWKDAQQACFNYLVTETNSEAGVNAFLGDRLPNTKGNLWCFILSGGRDQIQNYQVAQAPGFTFYSNAVLRGQFETMEGAMDFASLVLQQLPAYKDPDYAGQPGGYLKDRGLTPNVSVFENTVHPELFSDVVELTDADKKGDYVSKDYVQWWIVVVEFRVVYYGDKT